MWSNKSWLCFYIIAILVTQVLMISLWPLRVGFRHDLTTIRGALTCAGLFNLVGYSLRYGAEYGMDEKLRACFRTAPELWKQLHK